MTKFSQYLIKYSNRLRNFIKNLEYIKTDTGL